MLPAGDARVPLLPRRRHDFNPLERLPGMAGAEGLFNGNAAHTFMITLCLPMQVLIDTVRAVSPNTVIVSVAQS